MAMPDVGWAIASIRGEAIGNEDGPLLPPAPAKAPEESIEPAEGVKSRNESGRRGGRGRDDRGRNIEEKGKEGNKAKSGDEVVRMQRQDNDGRSSGKEKNEPKVKARLDAIETEIHSREERYARERSQCESWRGDLMANGQLSAEELLGRQIKGLWISTRPSERNLRMRASIVKDVEKWISTRYTWEGCGLQVEAFGSTKTGLLEEDSDMDLVLKDPTRPLGVGTPKKDYIPLAPGLRPGRLENPTIAGENAPNWNSVAHVARRLMSSRYYVNVLPVTRAKVPIVKFTHGPSGLVMDLNINDRFGEANSRLIAAYADVRPELVRPLLFAVKRWFARRGLNNPSPDRGHRSLNSYTICLIALQFLQLRGFVPNLQSPSLLAELDMPKEVLWQRVQLASDRGRDRRRAKRAQAEAKGGDMHIGRTESDGKGQEFEPRSDSAATTTTAEEIAVPDETATDLVDSPIDDIIELGITVDPDTGARGFDTTFATLSTEQQIETAARSSQSKVHETPFDPKRGTNFNLEEQLGSLLRDFFEWLADFDFNRYGFSLKHGEPFLLQRALTGDEGQSFKQPHHWQDEPIVCQDPFIVDRNTAGGVVEEIKGIIASEVKQAFKSLAGPKADFPLLCDLCADEVLVDLRIEQQALRSKHQDGTRKVDVGVLSDAPKGPRARAKEHVKGAKDQGGKKDGEKLSTTTAKEPAPKAGKQRKARQERGAKAEQETKKESIDGKGHREAREKGAPRATQRARGRGRGKEGEKANESVGGPDESSRAQIHIHQEQRM